MINEQIEPKFAGYAVYEAMGHIRVAGYCKEGTFAGTAGTWVHVPKQDAPCWVNADPPSTPEIEWSQFFSAGSLFRFTPCKASIARAIAKNSRPIELSYFEEEALDGQRKLQAHEEEPEVEGEIVPETPGIEAKPREEEDVPY